MAGAAISENHERATELAGMLKAMGHPVRLRIIAMLCEGDCTVSELTARLGVPQAVASQQLRILRMSRLVAVRRAKGFAHYSLGEPNLVRMIDCMQSCSVH